VRDEGALPRCAACMALTEGARAVGLDGALFGLCLLRLRDGRVGEATQSGARRGEWYQLPAVVLAKLRGVVGEGDAA